MTEEYKNELIEKLEELEIRELLDILLNEDNPKTKQIIKNFIAENFMESPQHELNKSIKDIKKMNYPDFQKERLTNVKILIKDITEKLHDESFNSFEELENIFSESIKFHKILPED